MRLRNFAGAAAAGALAIGGLAALAAPAQAATTASFRGAFECTASYSGMAMKANLASPLKISVDGTNATAAAGSFSNWSLNGGDLPAGFTIRGVTLNVDTTINGAAHTLTGASTGVDYPTNVPVPTPALSASSTVTDVTAGKINAVSGNINLFVPFAGRAVPVAFTCAGEGEAYDPANEAPAGGEYFACGMDFGGRTISMGMPTGVDLKAQRKGANIDLSVALGELPIKSIPVPLDKVPYTATLTGTVDGQAVELKGSSQLTAAPNSPLPTPVVSTSIASAATSVAFVPDKLTLVAVHPMMTVQVDCVADGATHTGAVTPEPVVVKAVATKSVTKVAYNKKKKTAVVTTTVKAGKKNAAGKVTITVKKGKKVVAKKTLTLKNGKVTLKLSKKQLKAKGLYAVTANYAGAKAFKKSAAKKVTFRVK